MAHLMLGLLPLRLAQGSLGCPIERNSTVGLTQFVAAETQTVVLPTLTNAPRGALEHATRAFWTPTVQDVMPNSVRHSGSLNRFNDEV